MVAKAQIGAAALKAYKGKRILKIENYSNKPLNCEFFYKVKIKYSKWVLQLRFFVNRIKLFYCSLSLLLLNFSKKKM
jgi:hypothetical protein